MRPGDCGPAAAVWCHPSGPPAGSRPASPLLFGLSRGCAGACEGRRLGRVAGTARGSLSARRHRSARYERPCFGRGPAPQTHVCLTHLVLGSLSLRSAKGGTHPAILGASRAKYLDALWAAPCPAGRIRGAYEKEEEKKKSTLQASERAAELFEAGFVLRSACCGVSHRGQSNPIHRGQTASFRGKFRSKRHKEAGSGGSVAGLALVQRPSLSHVAKSLARPLGRA